jgi:hypothetical protein
MDKRNDRCLAEGEVTGHSHCCLADDVEVFGQGTERRLSAPSGTAVRHEEHKQITLPPGEYNITRQREIDPDTEESRAVAD